MSLTRKEWEEMWKMTKRLEYYVNDLPSHIDCKKFTKKYIHYVKEKIQQVIGQME